MNKKTTILTLFILLGVLACATTQQAEPPPPPAETVPIQHVHVYYELGMFGGWPANHGIWSWGNEILVGFSKGYYKDLGDRHHIDREKPEMHMLARSLDGGESWTIEDPGAKGYLLTEGGFLHGVPRPGVTIPPMKECEGGINFTHPDFAMTVRTDSVDAGTSRFFYSYDRGHTWEGPFRLPNFGAPGVAARTDYIVNGESDCMLFLTAAKSDGEEGRLLCVRTTDGGKTWERVSWIGPEPQGFEIMPASVRLSETDILVTGRVREGPRRWISAYLSQDNGQTWQKLDDAVEDCGIGNPPAMIQLEDGRICLIYGFRGEPYSIRARLSSDGGRSWSDDYVLRDDGASRDIGYPRVIQRPDGKVVALYYFTDPKTGPERYIGATIWQPPPAS
jgi:hypothetical protein